MTLSHGKIEKLWPQSPSFEFENIAILLQKKVKAQW